jgi:hypothetical protein
MNKTKTLKKLTWWSALLAIALTTIILPTRATAQGQDDQNQQDDPPSRGRRHGVIEG